MIITRTPFRMSFFGGGTDVKGFFEKYRGAVISTTFDKYCYITVRHLPRFFSYATEIVYAKTERVNSIEDIQHPVVRNAMKMLNMHELRISYDADLPARSGLGTSSSFAVGLLNALYCLEGKYVSKKELADRAIYLERVLCREAGGWQDQIAASFGGLNRIDFNEDGYRVRPIIISKERKHQLNKNLFLYFTGFTRFSSEMQKLNQTGCKNQEEHLKAMLDLVDQAEDTLSNSDVDLDDFGRLLNETWELKKETGKAVTNENIDELYARGIKNGALGGKLLGAGGGGFLLFYVPGTNQSVFKKAMSDLLYVPFCFEDEGTRVIQYVPEDYMPKEDNHS